MATDEIVPFRIDIPQPDLDELFDRLGRTRWASGAPGEGDQSDAWARGVPVPYLRELVSYWCDGYDWRTHEARLNEWPQFTTTIDGQRLHFAHVPSPEPGARPLIMTHGWPGSIVEFCQVVGPLTDPGAHGGDPDDAFHVVVPSIPGYGFSGPVTAPGWNSTRVAGALAELMSRLGYDRYFAQGGDWGSVISRALGVVDAEHVVGIHLNMLLTGAQPADPILGELSEDEIARLDALRAWRHDGAGYLRVQATRPQTLAYALTDSPVGQLAWIVEKFKEWTDSRTVPEDAVDRDLLLTNVMIYWLTGTAGSSAQLYWEDAHHRARPVPSATPTGVAVFPRDIALPVRRLAERTENIVHWTEFERGGHFAALEQPALLVDDIRATFRALARQGTPERTDAS